MRTGWGSATRNAYLGIHGILLGFLPRIAREHSRDHGYVYDCGVVKRTEKMRRYVMTSSKRSELFQNIDRWNRWNSARVAAADFAEGYKVKRPRVMRICFF